MTITPHQLQTSAGPERGHALFGADRQALAVDYHAQDWPLRRAGFTFDFIPSLTGRALRGVRSFSGLPFPHSRRGLLQAPRDSRPTARTLPAVGRHTIQAGAVRRCRPLQLKPSNHFICQGADCPKYHRPSPSEIRGSYASTRRTIGGQNLGNPNQTNE